MSASSTVSKDSIDALLSGATPQFSMQLKARLWDMIKTLPQTDDARVYGEQQMALLDSIAFGTTRGTGALGTPGAGEPGWNSLPSHPASGR